MTNTKKLNKRIEKLPWTKGRTPAMCPAIARLATTLGRDEGRMEPRRRRDAA